MDMHMNMHMDVDMDMDIDMDVYIRQSMCVCTFTSHHGDSQPVDARCFSVYAQGRGLLLIRQIRVIHGLRIACAYRYSYVDLAALILFCTICATHA